MRNLILVSKTPIVIQIFNLICRKLNINLEVLSEAQIDHKVDIIVVDKEFIDERYTILKTYTKQIGAITNEELSFDMANDFTIPSPFLPSQLQQILEEQLSEVSKKINSKTYISNIPKDELEILIEQPIEDDTPEEELEPALDYLDSIAQNIVDDVDEENDDSIITSTSIQNDKGGILDLNELSKLESLIESDMGIDDEFIEDIKTGDENEEEWLDLSSIIDQAINEVNSVESLGTDFENKPIKLILNDYSLNELKPLLSLLNQDIIDSLTEGYEINLQLKLGNNNDKES